MKDKQSNEEEDIVNAIKEEEGSKKARINEFVNMVRDSPHSTFYVNNILVYSFFTNAFYFRMSNLYA